jgi:hypothetical protein
MQALADSEARVAAHAIRFRDNSRNEINLHWRVLWLWSEETVNRRFWNGSVPLEVSGATTRPRIPSPIPPLPSFSRIW